MSENYVFFKAVKIMFFFLNEWIEAFKILLNEHSFLLMCLAFKRIHEWDRTNI